MKPQLFGAQERVSAPSLCGSAAVRSIQEKLVAAIHGALEVAVELAVREVKALVGQATNDMYEELRRENETLNEKLQRAEQMLADSVRIEEKDSSVRREGAPHPSSCRPNANNPEITGEPAGHGCPGPDLRDKYLNGQELPADAASEPEKEHNTDLTEITSQRIALKTEGVMTCQNPQAPESAPPLSTAIKSTMEQVTIKQEEVEEERSRASCCLDLIKEENTSNEAIQWPPELTGIQNQDPEAHHFSGMGENGRPPNMGTSLPPPSDLQSISAEFPNIFHLAEQASVSQAPPQVHGFHAKTDRSVSTVPTCKLCGQTFPLPSLLRRHYGQCRQRLQQRCQPSVAGDARTRLQLYPPGCSPFCCTVCNREFNRLENLKTHLRIHTGERPYTCSVCLRCFRHSGALTRHFRIHTGEKPYVCGQCGRCFRNCAGLKFHQRSHSKQLQ